MALNEVCKIKNGLEVIAVKLFHQLSATICHITINFLLILMKKNDVVLCCVISHSSHSAEHLIVILLRVLPLRHKEAEHPNVRNLHHMSNIYRVAEQLKVVLKILRNRYLADRGSDGGQMNVILIQLLLDLLHLIQRVLHKSLSVCSAHLHIMHAELLQHTDLLIQLRIDFIRKAAQFYLPCLLHICSFFLRTCGLSFQS